MVGLLEAYADSSARTYHVEPARHSGGSGWQYIMPNMEGAFPLTQLWPTRSETAVVFMAQPQIELWEGPIASDWLLARPIQLSVEYEWSEQGISVIAFEEALNIYGTGDTVAAAVDECLSMLVDLVEELRASQDVLSAHLRQRLAQLSTVVAPR